MNNILKIFLSALTLIKPYNLPLPNWVTADLLSSIYKNRLIPIGKTDRDEGYYLRTRFDAIFGIITVLSNNKPIEVMAGPFIRAISKFMSIFFLFSLVISLIVILEEPSSFGRFLIVTSLGFLLLTSLVNFAHFLQYLSLRISINVKMKKNGFVP